jgi:Kef-type K+ transport system membrane component KefB
MFEVGVESTVPKLLAVGQSALMVAIIGVIAPFLLGFAMVRIFFPYLSLWVDVFLGATLCATSVGISARVLKDLGKVQTQEGRIILAAAVVDDDVLGLIVLAVVAAIIVMVFITTAMTPPLLSRRLSRSMISNSQ